MKVAKITIQPSGMGFAIDGHMYDTKGNLLTVNLKRYAMNDVNAWLEHMKAVDFEFMTIWHNCNENSKVKH